VVERTAQEAQHGVESLEDEFGHDRVCRIVKRGKFASTLVMQRIASPTLRAFVL